MNHTFLDWSIDTAAKKQESDALINIIYNGHYPKNAIFTADRGYENYNLFAHFIENNIKLVRSQSYRQKRRKLFEVN